MRVYRDIARATDEQLAGMRDAITKLRDYDHFLAGDMMTALCVLDEAAAKEQARRPLAEMVADEVSDGKHALNLGTLLGRHT